MQMARFRYLAGVARGRRLRFLKRFHALIFCFFAFFFKKPAFAFAKIALCALFWIFFATTVRADFRVCNSTQGFIGVAMGYPVGTGWVSEGWWHIGAARCKTVIEGPLKARFYYLYAEDVSGKGRWDGLIAMCGQTSKFRIEGLNDCFARGFQRFNFQEIDTENQTSWMVELREPEMGSDVFSDPLGSFVLD